mmetsp:Transcript_109670/g.189757  ORF Transcript_109670/g.189757 Transcript_109670/m.189757 type:complete len:550 (-) Transcript_109670:48-1697(-)
MPCRLTTMQCCLTAILLHALGTLAGAHAGVCASDETCELGEDVAMSLLQTSAATLSSKTSKADIWENIRKDMTQNGFRRVRADHQDDYHANPKDFKERNLTFPAAKADLQDSASHAKRLEAESEAYFSRCKITKLVWTISCISFMFLAYFLLVKVAVGMGSSGADSEDRRSGDVPKQRLVLRSIDGLRAVFTLVILLAHMANWIIWHGDSSEVKGLDLVSPSLRGTLLRASQGAMQFFFVASGYVCFLAEFTPGKRFNLQSSLIFVLKRFARLAPAYYLALLVSVVLFRDCEQWPARQALMVHTLCKGWFTWDPNSVLWFVGTLMILSCCFPLLYNVVPEGPRVLTVLLAFVVVVRSLPELFGDWLQESGEQVMWYTSPYVRVFEFLAGVLAAKLCCTLDSSCFGGKLWGLTFDATFIAVFIFLARPVAPHGPKRDYFLTGPMCIMLIAAYAVESQICNEQGFTFRWFFGQVLSSAVLQFFARHAYTIYLVQVPCLIAVGNYLGADCWFGANAKAILLMFSFVVCVGALCSMIVQEPLARLLLKHMQRS